MIISSRVQLRDAAYRNRDVRQGIPGEVLNPPGDSTNTLRLEACLQEYRDQQAGRCRPRHDRNRK